MTDPELDTHGYRLRASKKHKDQLITRVPVSYLTWMISEGHPEAPYARAELDRRGTIVPSLDVSGHAIDRASQTCIRRWKKTRKNENEGLHAWLVRMSHEAIERGKKVDDKIAYQGLKFVFKLDNEWPVLITVMIDNAAPNHAGKKRRVIEHRDLEEQP